jgi:hypothetical protein
MYTYSIFVYITWNILGRPLAPRETPRSPCRFRSQSSDICTRLPPWIQPMQRELCIETSNLRTSLCPTEAGSRCSTLGAPSFRRHQRLWLRG